VLERDPARFLSRACTADSIGYERQKCEPFCPAEYRRIWKARVIHLELSLKRADEEMILIVRAHLPRMCQSVYIELGGDRTWRFTWRQSYRPLLDSQVHHASVVRMSDKYCMQPCRRASISDTGRSGGR
jgi:hypothetical protein